MLDKNYGKQGKFVTTTLEQLMPEKHFLRDLDRYVNFDFIYDKMEHLYSHTGCRAVDPVVLIKMILLGFLYNIDSERKLEKEVEVNIAYRWFLGIDLDETAPDHSTLSQTRRRKWRGTGVFEEIFDEVVRKCIECGLVDGELILTDSTHVKANASWEKHEIVTVTSEPREYIKKLDDICEQEEQRVRAEAIRKGHKKCTMPTVAAPKTKNITKSTTDPDCGILSRPRKAEGIPLFKSPKY